MSCREETWREKMETWDTGQGSRTLLSSNPCLNPEPVTPELLRKYLYPLTGLGQSSLSDSDHNASSAFPVQKWREKSGRAPLWPQGWWLDTWAPLWPPYPRSAQALPRLPAVGECCAHKLVSIQCQVQSVSCFPKYTLTCMFLSTKQPKTLASERIRYQGCKTWFPGRGWSSQTYSMF